MDGKYHFVSWFFRDCGKTGLRKNGKQEMRQREMFFLQNWKRKI